MSGEDQDAKFDADEITVMLNAIIDEVIGSEVEYNNTKIKAWSTQITDQCMKHLFQANKPFKYTVNCGIMQKNGSGLHSACSCYWDSSTDGICIVRWENPTIHCIVTVFGFAL